MPIQQFTSCFYVIPTEHKFFNQSTADIEKSKLDHRIKHGLNSDKEFTDISKKTIKDNSTHLYDAQPESELNYSDVALEPEQKRQDYKTIFQPVSVDLDSSPIKTGQFANGDGSRVESGEVDVTASDMESQSGDNRQNLKDVKRGRYKFQSKLDDNDKDGTDFSDFKNGI